MRRVDLVALLALLTPTHGWTARTVVRSSRQKRGGTAVASAVKLRAVWLPTKLGVAVDYTSGAPLSSYFFWPSADVYSQLRIELESKPWLSTVDREELLKEVSKIICWIPSGGTSAWSSVPLAASLTRWRVCAGVDAYELLGGGWPQRASADRQVSRCGISSGHSGRREGARGSGNVGADL
jgi:hypothetical protein